MSIDQQNSNRRQRNRIRKNGRKINSKNNNSSNYSYVPQDTYEQCRAVVSRLCRRRYTSISEKIAASKHKTVEYNTLLRKKASFKSKAENNIALNEIEFETTETLSKVLQQFEEVPTTQSCDTSVHLNTLCSMGYGSKDEERQLEIEDYIEKESKLYREAKLYTDIGTNIIEIVAIIERIGSNSSDWRRSVVHYTPAERTNMIYASALELDALNNVKNKRKITSRRVNNSDKVMAGKSGSDLKVPPITKGKIIKQHSFKQRLQNTLRWKKKSGKVNGESFPPNTMKPNTNIAKSLESDGNKNKRNDFNEENVVKRRNPVSSEFYSSPNWLNTSENRLLTNDEQHSNKAGESLFGNKESKNQIPYGINSTETLKSNQISVTIDGTVLDDLSFSSTDAVKKDSDTVTSEIAVPKRIVETLAEAINSENCQLRNSSKLQIEDANIDVELDRTDMIKHLRLSQALLDSTVQESFKMEQEQRDSFTDFIKMPNEDLELTVRKSCQNGIHTENVNEEEVQSNELEKETDNVDNLENQEALTTINSDISSNGIKEVLVNITGSLENLESQHKGVQSAVKFQDSPINERLSFEPINLEIEILESESSSEPSQSDSGDSELRQQQELIDVEIQETSPFHGILGETFSLRTTLEEANESKHQIFTGNDDVNSKDDTWKTVVENVKQETNQNVHDNLHRQQRIEIFLTPSSSFDSEDNETNIVVVVNEDKYINISNNQCSIGKNNVNSHSSDSKDGNGDSRSIKTNTKQIKIIDGINHKGINDTIDSNNTNNSNFTTTNSSNADNKFTTTKSCNADNNFTTTSSCNADNNFTTTNSCNADNDFTTTNSCNADNNFTTTSSSNNDNKSIVKYNKDNYINTTSKTSNSKYKEIKSSNGITSENNNQNDTVLSNVDDSKEQCTFYKGNNSTRELNNNEQDKSHNPRSRSTSPVRKQMEIIATSKDQQLKAGKSGNNDNDNGGYYDKTFDDVILKADDGEMISDNGINSASSAYCVIDLHTTIVNQEEIFSTNV